MTRAGPMRMPRLLAGSPSYDVVLSLQHYLTRMLGYDHGFPELGSTYGFATVEDKFEYTEVSCKGNEMSLLDCPFK